MQAVQTTTFAVADDSVTSSICKASKKATAHSRSSLSDSEQNAWRRYLAPFGPRAMYCDPGWVTALCNSFSHEPHFISAVQNGQLVGVLPLAFVNTRLFGRYLVSLPYLNWAGVIADDDVVTTALIDEAVRLADELDVRQLQLRHLSEIPHPALTHRLTSKVQMRLPLNERADQVWSKLRSVVRTQIRKADKFGLELAWGRHDVLDEFYQVFSRNMRDLGTPVFGKNLFDNILCERRREAELCVVRYEGKVIAGALAVHGPTLTEVPSACALRSYRHTAANCWMYWQVIRRVVERGQQWFDFGRSSIGSSTYEFKKKWGTQDVPTVWQLYVRQGEAADLRPESGRFRLAIRVWQHLPVSVSRLIGPMIVRGIP